MLNIDKLVKDELYPRAIASRASFEDIAKLTGLSRDTVYGALMQSTKTLNPIQVGTYLKLTHFFNSLTPARQ